MVRVNCVDYLLKKFFYKLGVVVAKYPGYFIIIPIFLTLICVTGLQRLHYVMDSEYLFSPVEGLSRTERTIFESYFKMNYSHRFNPTRLTRPGKYSKMIIIPKDGDNMLTSAIWSELRALDETVKNVTITYGEDGQRFTYKDLCARWIDACFENDLLNLDAVIDQVESKQLNLTFPIMINPITWDAHVFSSFFGGTVLNEDIIERVPSLQLMYFLADDTKQDDEKAVLWEDAFLDAIDRAERTGQFQYISTARFASRTLDVELENNMRAVEPYFATTFGIMIFFSIVTSMMTDWVRSKPMLGLLGNVSAGMGTIAAFGLAVYCGVDFIGINLIAPFLTCSIGIDDTYVMLAAWRRTPVTMDVPERTGHMLSEAAVSITITSLTDIVSLWIGNKSPFPAIEIFCTYTGLAVTFILLWHVTFFTACVAIYGYIEQKNKHSITCLPILPVSQAHNRSWLYRLFCTGGINTKDPDNPQDNSENVFMVWFRDFVGTALTKWPVKILVILLFLAYLAGAIHGVSRVQEGLQRRKLSKPDSYSIEYYDREDYYFKDYPYRIQVLVNGELDYWDESVQYDIENLTRSFEQCQYISSNTFYTESWLRSFLGYVDRNQDSMNISIDTREGFVETLKELWLFKPNPFSLDVKFSDDGTKIVASRFIIQAINVTGENSEVYLVRELRKIAEQSSLNVTVFHPYFLFFDQFELVKPTCIQQMLVGGAIMMIITFLFIPNFICSFWVAAAIVSIEAGVIGYMALWDVNLDAISMVNLIMCIGFSVDFTAHICYAYVSSSAEGTNDKTKESLYSLGLPVFQGAASTILGVSALLFVGSYIFLVFFKMMFLVTVIGALHGVFLLPVLLSMFGRRGPKKAKPDLKKYPSAFCIPPYPTLPPPPPPPLTNIHHPKHFGIPLHGMVQGSIRNFYNDKRAGKFDGHEKDLGLGTSEDSSEASSFESQRKQQAHMQQKYMEGWRKSSMTGDSRRGGGHGFGEEERHWNNISIELMNRAKANANAYMHHRNYK